MPSESTSPQSCQASCLPLSMLRLAVLGLLLFGLAIAPVDTTHGVAKYLGEAAELALDACPDIELEEVDGDGPEIWQTPGSLVTFTTNPLRPCDARGTSLISRFGAPLPARGPPELV